MTQSTSMTAMDPVCRMQVEERTAPARTEHDGRTYYFCSEDCLKAFQKDTPSFLPKM